MPIFVAALVLIVLAVGAVMRRLQDWRADRRLQRSILVYDEARRERIRRGEDPRRIPTVEEDLHLKGYGALVGQIKRVPWSDPPPPRPASDILPSVRIGSPSAPNPVSPMAEPTRLSNSGERTPILEPSRPLPLPDRRMVPSKPVVPDEPPPRPKKPHGTFPFGHRFLMEYADVNGEITTREIRVEGIERYAGHVAVAAFCFMRLDQRHFRVDRILQLTDGASGEVIHDPAALFTPHSVDVPTYLGPGTIEVSAPHIPLTLDQQRLLERITAGLDVLVWITRADNGPDEADHETIFSFVTDRLALPRSRAADLTWNREFVKAWLQGRRPTLATCNATLAAMSDKSRERPILKRAAEALARTETRAKRLRQLARLLP